MLDEQADHAYSTTRNCSIFSKKIIKGQRMQVRSRPGFAITKSARQTQSRTRGRKTYNHGSSPRRGDVLPLDHLLGGLCLKLITFSSQNSLINSRALTCVSSLQCWRRMLVWRRGSLRFARFGKCANLVAGGWCVKTMTALFGLHKGGLREPRVLRIRYANEKLSTGCARCCACASRR